MNLIGGFSFVLFCVVSVQLLVNRFSHGRIICVLVAYLLSTNMWSLSVGSQFCPVRHNITMSGVTQLCPAQAQTFTGKVKGQGHICGK